jgi:TonB family protein
MKVNEYCCYLPSNCNPGCVPGKQGLRLSRSPMLENLLWMPHPPEAAAGSSPITFLDRNPKNNDLLAGMEYSHSKVRCLYLMYVASGLYRGGRMRPSRGLNFIAFCFLMTLFTPVFAQQPNGSGVYVVGPGIEEPVPLFQPLPAYTPEARVARVEGIVFLQAIIRKDGAVDSFKVLRGLGYSLEESAIYTISKKWRFRPGTLNGEPVDVQVNIAINFKLSQGPGEVESLVPSAAQAQAPAGQTVDTPAKAVPAAIPADQQATKEQLANLFELMRVREQVASLSKTLPALMLQQITARMKQMQQNNPALASPTQEQQQAISKSMNRFMERVLDLYKSDEMIAEMTELYQKYFTRSDVDGIIAFYSSPAGQRLLDIQPVIMSLVMQRMQNRVKTSTDEMQKELMELIKPNAPSADKPTKK